MTNEKWSEVKNSWVKFNKIGDYVIGTLISVREIDSQLPAQKGQKVRVYEVKTDEGSFHDIDDKKQVIEPAVTINADEIWNIGGGSKEKPAGIDSQFRNIKLGQKIKVEFTKELEPKTKGFSPTKVKQVFTNGKFDDEWLKKQEEERQAAAEFNAQ